MLKLEPLSRTVRKKYKNGFFVDLPYGYQQLVNNGWYENSEIETQDWMIDNVQENWICFDVGAHIGYYSFLMSHLAPKGTIYSIEPSALTIQMMKANMSYNKKENGYDLSNIYIFQTAMGHRTGRFTETMWMLDGGEGDFGEQRVEMDFITLDKFHAEHLLPPINLIKIDTDGWDYDVLLGARNIAEKFHPFIIAECNYALSWRGHALETFKALAHDLGYAFKFLDEGCPCNCLLY